MPARSKRNYDLAAKSAGREIAAPRLDYRPGSPKRCHPGIGLIGCGGISAAHLDAYRAAGWNVVALCNRSIEKARARRDEFFPDAKVCSDFNELLALDEVDVVDVALHPRPRLDVIEAALNAGKHVLSQKPFVEHLDDGRRLARLASRRGLKLAVNTNGRWAPYVRYAALAVRKGLLGEVQSVNISLNWDHTWIKGTPFERVPNLLLHDFAIHWFDMCGLFFGGAKAKSVFASVRRASGQSVKPPLIGSAVVTFPGGTAALHFDGCSRFGARETLVITGGAGTLRAEGPLCRAHEMEIFTKRGVMRPKLDGAWFNDGFRGTMGELLCAVEDDREPENSARQTLPGLALCLAAIRSAKSGRAERV